MEVKEFPRPPSDNGRGLVGTRTSGWSGGIEGYDYWIAELVAMGIKWLKVVDSGGDSLSLCEKLVAAGIFPIVHILRKDPPPNDLPEPNPGHIGNPEEETIRRLIAAGVRYFETNSEPDRASQWKNAAMPGDTVETAKLVALNWLFDARLILELGGLPGLPAISSGGNMDLVAALVSLGRQDILLRGAWIAIHNYCANRPLTYPDDPVNRAGQPLTPELYYHQVYTPWVWWNSELNRIDIIDQVNAERAAYKNPSQTILGDHACFREFEYYNHLAIKYLGRSIPILSTEGGYLIGRRDDTRYPRVTPEAHRDQTVALFDFMQRQAPDYYFAAAPAVLWETPGSEMDAWAGNFWKNTLANGSNGRNGIPRAPVAGATIGDHLPVIEAVKAMPNLPRRLPGAQPPPPVQPAVTAAPPVQPTVTAPAPAPKVAPPPPVVPQPAISQVVPTQPMISQPSKPPEPTEMPEREPAMIKAKTPSPSLLFSTLPIPALDWDPRLDALNVTLERAEISTGQMYWKLIRAEYQGPDEADGKHIMAYTVQDENGKPVEYQRVWQGWAEDKTDATTNDKGEATIPLWASFSPERGESGPYRAWVDGLPSDRINGLGLPLKRQVNFLLTWQRVIA